MVDHQQEDTQLKQVHDYVRHTWGTLVNWFTFFIGVNYVAMGWFATTVQPLAKPGGDEELEIVRILAVVFIVQNLLGIAAEILTLRYFKSADAQVRRAGGGEDACIPMRVYRPAVYLMVVALVPVLITWAWVFCHSWIPLK